MQFAYARLSKEAVTQCDGAKRGKDVEPEEIGQHPLYFEEYRASLRKFSSILTALHQYDRDLIAVEQKARQDYRTQRNWALIGIAATIVTAVVGILIALQSTK